MVERYRVVHLDDQGENRKEESKKMREIFSSFFFSLHFFSACCLLSLSLYVFCISLCFSLLSLSVALYFWGRIGDQRSFFDVFFFSDFYFSPRFVSIIIFVIFCDDVQLKIIYRQRIRYFISMTSATIMSLR